jgi:hypothetical protein
MKIDKKGAQKREKDSLVIAEKCTFLIVLQQQQKLSRYSASKYKSLTNLLWRGNISGLAFSAIQTSREILVASQSSAHESNSSDARVHTG